MKIMMLLFKSIQYDARVQREALALAKAGYEVDIACLTDGKEMIPKLHPNIVIFPINLQTNRIKRKANMTSIGSIVSISKFLKDVTANKEYYNQVKRLMAQQNYEFVHCHDLNTLPIGYYLSKGFKTKLVYDSHELYNEMANKSNIEKKIGYAIERYFIRAIDHLIVVNFLAGEEFLKRYGRLTTTIIENIPDQTLNENPPDQEVLRDLYNLSEEDILILYQGGLSPERGLDECLEALTLLHDHFKLILIGDGTIKLKLKQLAYDLKIENRVFFHDQVPPTYLMYYTRQADIGLVMYKNTCLNNYLSTPNKIFEYLWAEVPTVASNHPGKSYVIDQAQSGLCVAEDPQSIARGIQRLTKDLLEYKDNCRRNKERYKWEREAQQLVNLYKRWESEDG